jgi:hypothetical protein
LHNFIGLNFVINLEGEEIFGSSELELSDTVLLVLLDGDLLSTGETLLFSSDNLNELLEVLDFLGLYNAHSYISSTTLPYLLSVFKLL